MRWQVGAVVLLTALHISPSLNAPHSFPTYYDLDNDLHKNEADVLLDLNSLLKQETMDEKLRQIIQTLLQPWPEGYYPLVYIEENRDKPNSHDNSNEINKQNENYSTSNNKRSRYVRKYPWKRQNSPRYELDNRYVCYPRKGDVFRLVSNLHDSKDSPDATHLHFCNLKRPADWIFTNLRFMGK